ncbi:MAG TPA: hypothetical protein PLK63_10155 [Catalimonadaceae bacterium]|nr:hypothetical protein [Catalimonadaceae bacterium]
MKNVLIRLSVSTLMSVALVSIAFSAAPPLKPGQSNNGTTGTTGTTGTNAADCAIGLSRAELDINNVRARYLNAGDMFWDPGLSLAKYEVPKRTDNLTSSKNSIFAAAIWLGGTERQTGNVLVMVQTYRGNLRNYWPGPIQYTDTSLALPTSKKVCSAWDQHFKCNRRTVKQFVDDYEAGTVSCEQIPLEIKYWPGKGNPFLKQKAEFAADPSAVASVDNNLANFYDRDNNGVYNPCNGDYPLWAGTEADFNCEKPEININQGADQVIWWVCNDAGNKKNFLENTTAVPEIGMEVHYEAFAYASTDATNDMTFLRQKLYNKGSVILDNTYLAQWVDPDLGNAGDDYVGCDVMRGLGICYNGDENDEGATGYGENPPAVGVDFFRGPFPDDSLDIVDWDLDCSGPFDVGSRDTAERITMSGFVYYNIGGDPITGDPSKFSDFYNYLRNRWKDGNHVKYGGNGRTGDKDANYMFPHPLGSKISDPYGFACGATSCSSPVDCGDLWNEVIAGNAPGDRRFLANNGPFTLEPGDFNECTIGIVWARASSGGPTGSFGKLLAADDLAQKRFNDCFKRKVGPNSPNLEIVESNRNLIFTIIPDTIVKSPLMTTESYRELDRDAKIGDPANPQELEYKFQGYKIYQLFDDKVSVQDLSNPDKARLLDGDVDGDENADFTGLMDVKDGVSSINNLVYDPELDAEVSTPMVRNTPDDGIFHSFKVTKDMFNPSGGNLSNFKKYYYAVVAYGYIRNNKVTSPYIQGVNNYKVFTAIPHNATPESFGTSLNYNYGYGEIQLTRNFGVGNSGNILELADGEENKILQENQVQDLTYKAGNGPVSIKIYNPKAVKKGQFQIRFSSRLRYRVGNHAFEVGDRIIADSGQSLQPGFNTIRHRESFSPGVATIRRVLPATDAPGYYDLDVDLDCTGGDFIYYLDQVELERQQFILKASKKIGMRFHLDGDTGLFAYALDFVKYDYWELTEKVSNVRVLSELPVSSVSEQIVPQFGISLRPKDSPDPGNDITNPLSQNGALPSSIVVDPDPLKFWIYGVSTSNYSWMRQDVFVAGEQYYAIDPKRSYSNFAGAGWLPFPLTDKVVVNPIGKTSFGGPQIPASSVPNPDIVFDVKSNESLSAMSKIGNVDIVFTSDKSKWTRCLVLQCDSFPASSSAKPKFQMAKSRRLSVGKDYSQDNSVSPYDGRASRGMSWFPGYAIDLDKGQRLNIMFSESSILDDQRGNDLKWEPRASLGGTEGTRNFIYVMNTKYDESRTAELFFDKLYTEQITNPVNTFLTKYRDWQLQNVMYAGLMGRGIDFIKLNEKPLDMSDVRVRLRVEKQFRTFAHNGQAEDCNPLYSFTLENSTERNSTKVASSALDLIRVVPNPYIAQSLYENSQVDNRVKIVNIPTQCVVSIFNLSGTLIRQYNFDQTSTKAYAAVADGVTVTNERGTNYQTFLDWDLKNQLGIPIASGVYIIHVKSDKLGEKTIKWFGVLRPIDLDTFN